MKLQVITPDRTLIDEEVDEVTLPTTSGEITVLNNHVPMVSALAAGVGRVKKGKNEYFLAIAGGFVQIQAGNVMRVLADSADRAEELDEQKIEAARREAEKILAEKRNVSDLEYAGVAAALERELARLKVARKVRHHGTKSQGPESE